MVEDLFRPKLKTIIRDAFLIAKRKTVYPNELRPRACNLCGHKEDFLFNFINLRAESKRIKGTWEIVWVCPLHGEPGEKIEDCITGGVEEISKYPPKPLTDLIYLLQRFILGTSFFLRFIYFFVRNSILWLYVGVRWGWPRLS